MFTTIKNCLFFLLQVTLLAALVGCKTMQSTPMPELKLPATVTNNTDSTQQFSWHTLFTDTRLSSIIDTALHSNPDLFVLLQQTEINRARLRIASGALFPSLNVAASASVDRYGEYTMNGIGNFDTNLSPNVDDDHKIPDPSTDYFLGLRSSWEIDIWGKLRNRKKAALARYLASREGLQWARTQVVCRVASMYYQLSMLDNQQQIIKKNVVLQQKAQSVIEAQMAGGRATSLAVQQFKAQKLRTQSALVDVQRQITRTENELNAILGRFPQPLATDTGMHFPGAEAILQKGLPAATLLHRPDIRQAEMKLSATRYDVQAARRAFLPSLNLTAYAGYNSFKMPFMFSPASAVYGLLGGITAPIFNRQTIRAGLAVADASQQAAFYQYQKTILQGYQEMVTALNAMEQYREMYRLRTEEVQELTQAVSTASDLYIGGYATYLEVITAQRNVLEAELAQTKLRRNIYDAMIDLYRASGGG